MSKEAKKNETKKDEKKPGLLKRAASWTWHTLADDRSEIEQDDRDLFQVVADSVLGRTPGHKVARSGVAVGGGIFLSGLLKGSATVVAVGGLTFLVSATGEIIQIVRGRNPKDDAKVAEIADAPVVTDDQAVEAAGMAEAAQAKDNLHAVLKSVFTGTLGKSKDLWAQVWSDVKNHEKTGAKVKPRYKELYEMTVACAKAQELITESPATN